MGLDLSRQKPAIQPFLAWDAARLDEFVAFVRACAGSSVILSRWHMLEFLSSNGCLESQVTANDVTALFTLFDEEDSAVNGLQLAVAILLCSHSPALEWRLSRCLMLFDWMDTGSLSDTELTMGLQVGLAALKHCCELVENGSEAVSFREIARRVVPSGTRTSLSKLVQWANSSQEEVLECLQHLKFEEKTGIPKEVEAAVAVPAPAETQPLVTGAVEPAATAIAEGAEGMDATESAEAIEAVSPQDEPPDERPSSAVATLPGSALADFSGGLPVEAEESLDPMPGLLAIMKEANGRACRGIVSEGARHMSTLAAELKTRTAAAAEGAGRRASEVIGLDLQSLSRRWRKSMGFLQPLAHAGTKSALISMDTSNLSLRNRVWLREALVCEEMRTHVHHSGLEQIGAALALGFVSGKVVAKSRRAAASQLRALVLELSGLAERGATLAIEALRHAALAVAQRLAVVASEVSRHAASTIPLRQQLEGEILRLEGAKQYLDLLPHQTVPAVPCKQQRWAAEQLQQGLQRRLSSMDDELGKHIEACTSELLTCSALYRALAAATGGELGPDQLEARFKQLQQESLDLIWSAEAVDQSVLRESYDFQERRLLCCEGAVAAQRALVRGTDLRSEVWLLQARRSVARVSYRKVVALLLGNEDAKTSSSSGSRPPCPRKRRKVLETFQEVLSRMQSSLQAPPPDAEPEADAATTEQGDKDRPTAIAKPPLSQVLSEAAQHVLQAIVGESSPGEDSQQREALGAEPAAGDDESSAPPPPVAWKEQHQSVDEGAWAHFRELRFAQRAHAAAVVVAQSMEESGLYDGLANRLAADLEQATEVLAEVNHSPAFQQRSVLKWKRIVDEVLQAVTTGATTLKEVQTEVAHRLAQLEVNLLLEVGHSSHVIPVASCKGLLLSCAALSEVDSSMPHPQDVQDLDGWCPVRGPFGQVDLSRHRHLAENVGVLWALELGRAEAGASTVSDSAFMVVKRCVQERVEAQILQVLAEEQMVEVQKRQTEDGMASLAVRSGSVQSGSPRLDAPRKSVVDGGPMPPLLEALVTDCLQLDLGSILRSWLAEPSLEGKSSVLSSLLASLEKHAGGSSTGQNRPPIGAPELPPLSAWWRTPATWIEQIATQPPCPRCLAVVQQLFSLRGSETSASHYAAWLRVWLLARARKAASHAVCSEEGGLAGLLIVQVQRSSMRCWQLLWRYRLLRQAVQDQLSLRQDALTSASRMLAPTDAACLDALDAKDIEAHVTEVLEAKDRALEESLASVLPETLQNFRDQGCDKAVMEGVEACKVAVAARRQAVEEDGAGIRHDANDSFTHAGSLSCPGVTASPSATATMSWSLHSTTQGATSGSKEDPACYTAQLSAVVLGLNLLKVAKELQVTSGE